MDIGEQDPAQLTYLALGAYLGEEVVETWIGAVTWPGEPPLDAFPLRHLRSVVTDFAVGWRDEEGQPCWVVLQGTGPAGSPVLAMAQVPLRQITFPLFDTHIAVTIPYADATPEGLPGPGSLEALHVLGDRIGAALGEDGRPLPAPPPAQVLLAEVARAATPCCLLARRPTCAEWVPDRA